MAHGVQLSVLNGLLNGLPIYNGDFADPYALVDGDSLYIYATSTTASAEVPAAHIPVIAVTRATGFAGHYLGDALPNLPAWTVPSYQWAPSVWGRPDGTFVLYYSTPATQPLDCVSNDAAPGCVRTTHGPNTAMCISRATSTSPSGPFVDDSSAAFICPTAEGGAIDPSIFVADDGTPWLLWKTDGDCCNLPTHIYSQQLSPDGLSTVGPPHQLIGATQAWEGGLVEAPSMVQSGSTFYLFYSANLWGTPDYSIGIARMPVGDGAVHQATGPGLAHEHQPGQRPGLRRVGVLRGRRGTRLDGAPRARAGPVGRLRRAAALRRPDGVPEEGSARRSRRARRRRHWPWRPSTTRTPICPRSPRPPTCTW